MTTHRLLPPVEVSHRAITLGGRTYSASPGSVVDAPDFDSHQLQANGWTLIAAVGTTAGRPSPAAAGTRYIDTTLGNVLIVSDGAAWRSTDGAAV